MDVYNSCFPFIFLIIIIIIIISYWSKKISNAVYFTVGGWTTDHQPRYVSSNAFKCINCKHSGNTGVLKVKHALKSFAGLGTNCIREICSLLFLDILPCSFQESSLSFQKQKGVCTVRAGLVSVNRCFNKPIPPL